MGVYRHIQLVTFYRAASVLNDPEAYALDIDHCAVWQNADVSSYGHARLHLCAAGCDAVPLATDVGVFLGTIGCAAERPGVCKGQIGLGVQFCGQLVYLGLELVNGFITFSGHALPVG